MYPSMASWRAVRASRTLSCLSLDPTNTRLPSPGTRRGCGCEPASSAKVPSSSRFLKRQSRCASGANSPLPGIMTVQRRWRCVVAIDQQRRGRDSEVWRQRSSCPCLSFAQLGRPLAGKPRLSLHLGGATRTRRHCSAGGPSLFATSGVTGGRPSVNSSKNGRFTNSGAPRMKGTQSPSCRA